MQDTVYLCIKILQRSFALVGVDIVPRITEWSLPGLKILIGNYLHYKIDCITYSGNIYVLHVKFSLYNGKIDI